MIQIKTINKGDTMNQYLITNSKDIRDHFEKDFPNTEEARHWIINHLDISKEWKITQATKKEKKKLDFDCAIEHKKIHILLNDLMETWIWVFKLSMNFVQKFGMMVII